MTGQLRLYLPMKSADGNAMPHTLHRVEFESLPEHLPIVAGVLIIFSDTKPSNIDLRLSSPHGDVIRYEHVRLSRLSKKGVARTEWELPQVRFSAPGIHTVDVIASGEPIASARFLVAIAKLKPPRTRRRKRMSEVLSA